VLGLYRERSIEGDVKRKHFSRGAGRSFSCFQPHVIELEVFWPAAPSARMLNTAAVSVFSPSGFHRFFAMKPVRSETHKQNGCQWQPWFYSGLVAHCYVGLSEGSTVILRLGARGTQSLSSGLRLTSNPSAPEPDSLPPGKIPRKGRTRSETLKLFAASDIWRRTRLLSSTQST
jgi:hypothetical protein